MNEQNNNQFNNMMNNNEQPMNQGMQNPQMMDSGMMNQEIPNPQNMNSGMMNQGMQNPQNMNSGMMNQEIPNPQNMNSGMMNQEIPNPQNMNSGVQNPNVQPKTSNGNKKVLFIVGGILLAVVAVVVFILALTGNSKTLTCTMSETSFGVTMDMEATVKFKGDKAKSAVALITVDLGSMASYKDTYLESLEESYSDYEKDGVDVEITSDDSKIYVKISGEDTNPDFIGSSEENYDAVKKDLEESGFTCK